MVKRKKGVIPPQFLAHPPPSWKGEMKKIDREAKEDLRKTRRTRRSRGDRKMSRRTHSRKDKLKWGEALLFGAAGYLAGNVLNETGIAQTIHNKLPDGNPLKEQIDMAYGISGGKLQGGNTIMKDVGVIGLAATLFDGARHGRIKKGLKDVVLPFSIGALLDPSKTESNKGGRW